MILVICLFKEQATTQIYTYGHTLSLHDALPISRPPTSLRRTGEFGETRRENSSRDVGDRRCTGQGYLCPQSGEELDGRGASRLAPPFASRRSEEHTSELQSLMRISYAVLCLKKKNNINNTHQINILSLHN